MKPTIVIGHKNPDTDSICSAICYANLKQITTGKDYIPCRAGQLNPESKYVLDIFGVKEPQIIQSLKPRLSDVQYREVKGIDPDTSLKRAWEYMRENNIRTVPVLDQANYVQGILTMGDIARFNMEDIDANAVASAKTSYKNIVDVLNGELVVGDINDYYTKGRVSVGAANPDLIEELIGDHDMIILGNRYDSQVCSIQMNAGCIIIALGSPISRTIKKLAEESNCAVISTPMDTYACARVINQSVPVKHIMRTTDLITFHCDDFVSDVKEVVAKKRIRYFPILDDSGKYRGMISQRNLLDVEQQEVILVDHNERNQAVEGIRYAAVTEIIDHHRIDAVETSNPIFFRNQPLGCTATIIAQIYREQDVEITSTIAGLLCSAIISDTLMFRSPTCTPMDRRIAKELAEIAGLDIDAHAAAMFRAGSQLRNRTSDELFYIDNKNYRVGDIQLSISQISGIDQTELDDLKPKMLNYLKKTLKNSPFDMLFAMMTNIITETTELLFAGSGSSKLIQVAFGKSTFEDSIVLPNVVSRKKQIVPRLISALENEV